MINWLLSKQDIRRPVSPDRITGSGVDPSRLSTFLKLSADTLLVFKWSQVQLFKKKCIWNMLWLSLWPCNIKILISNLPRTRKSSQLVKNTVAEDLFLPLSRVGHTLYVQFLCCGWSKFDRWVLAENLCSILKLVYFDSWSRQSFMSTCDVFNCTKWNTAVIHGWFVYWLFGWEKGRLSKSEIQFLMASFSFFTFLDA